MSLGDRKITLQQNIPAKEIDAELVFSRQVLGMPLVRNKPEMTKGRPDSPGFEAFPQVRLRYPFDRIGKGLSVFILGHYPKMPTRSATRQEVS
jgi:hypothetical protein